MFLARYQACCAYQSYHSTQLNTNRAKEDIQIGEIVNKYWKKELHSCYLIEERKDTKRGMKNGQEDFVKFVL